MAEWFAANGGTLLVVLILAALVILIIRVLIKDKKAGRSGCGAGCAGCAMHGSCHSKCAPDGKRKWMKMVTVELAIDGMACGMCEAHVNDAIRNRFKVKKLKSSYKKGTTVFQADEAPSEAELHEVLDPTGYKITGYKVSEK